LKCPLWDPENLNKLQFNDIQRHKKKKQNLKRHKKAEEQKSQKGENIANV
jgi:hypothetical protein